MAGMGEKRTLRERPEWGEKRTQTDEARKPRAHALSVNVADASSPRIGCAPASCKLRRYSLSQKA